MDGVPSFSFNEFKVLLGDFCACHYYGDASDPLMKLCDEYDVQYVFDKLDADGNSYVDMDEFVKVLTAWGSGDW